MYYGEIKNCDIANGEGVRISLFVSGCTNRCKNCFQPQTWDFCYGEPFDEDAENRILSLLSPEYINGLTVLGGEPFEPQNQRSLLPFIKRVREAYPNKNIWAYSGFTYEEMHFAALPRKQKPARNRPCRHEEKRQAGASVSKRGARTPLRKGARGK